MQLNESDRPVVIGAGPAGLAAAACLKVAGATPLLLERGPIAGNSWASHYDRLHLHTDSRRSSLPGFRFPKSAGKYPSRDDVVAYLGAYADHYQLDIQFGQSVRSVRKAGGSWVVATDSGTRFETTCVVVATGNTAEPVIPSWDGRGSFAGEIVHSSAYKNGERYAGKKVLVVGFGNSAGEIAIDLVEHGAHVAMSVRRPVTITRKELLGIPVLAISIPLSRIPIRLADTISRAVMRMAFGDAPRYGLQLSSRGAFSQVRYDRRTPLIDIGTMALIRAGKIAVRPAVKALHDTAVEFSDETVDTFDAIVAATGYRPACRDLFDDASFFDDAGVPLDEPLGGQPGLFFTGFTVASTGALYQISREAKEIARTFVRIRERSNGAATGRS